MYLILTPNLISKIFYQSKWHLISSTKIGVGFCLMGSSQPRFSDTRLRASSPCPNTRMKCVALLSSSPLHLESWIRADHWKGRKKNTDERHLSGRKHLIPTNFCLVPCSLPGLHTLVPKFFQRYLVQDLFQYNQLEPRCNQPGASAGGAAHIIQAVLAPIYNSVI